VNVAGIEELVTDKGYHSGAVVKRVKSYEVRSYLPEKQQQGRRNWQGKAEEQKAVYENRRPVRGEYGKSLLRRRGELVVSSLASRHQNQAVSGPFSALKTRFFFNSITAGYQATAHSLQTH
jgi:hypothetical protein